MRHRRPLVAASRMTRAGELEGELTGALISREPVACLTGICDPSIGLRREEPSLLRPHAAETVEEMDFSSVLRSGPTVPR